MSLWPLSFDRVRSCERAPADATKRYNTHPRGHHAAVRQGEEFALQARKEVDLDEPSVDALQTLLLLVLAFTAAGRGKKAYMSMSMSTATATWVLDLSS